MAPSAGKNKIELVAPPKGNVNTIPTRWPWSYNVLG